MFTGLVEQLGEVLHNTAGVVANHLIIKSPFEKTEVGESIAVNGVCLTLKTASPLMLSFDVSPETLKLTNLGDLLPGNSVNLERAMLATARFGGHYVSGHIDRTATLLAISKRDEYLEMVIGDFDACAILYLLPKGSIALDGVSLTINEVTNGTISVLLVPHTIAHTTLGLRVVGDRFNVEFDYFTRIVAHQLRLITL